MYISNIRSNKNSGKSPSLKSNQTKIKKRKLQTQFYLKVLISFVKVKKIEKFCDDLFAQTKFLVSMLSAIKSNTNWVN